MEPTTVRVILPPSNEPVGAAEAREAREALGVTQAEFARVMGVEPTTVANWESGATTPVYPRLWRWARRAVLEGVVEPGRELVPTT